MKEAELKTDMGAMAPLIIGGILVWALVLRPNAKKAGQIPPNGAAPAVEIREVRFEGSPAEQYITKMPGEGFLAYVTLMNPTTSEWRYEIELRFGEMAYAPAWTTDGTMPVLRGYTTMGPGATGTFGLPDTVPMDAKTKTYDIRVEVLVAGKGIAGGLADLEDRFTVPAPVAAPEVSILSVAWV